MTVEEQSAQQADIIQESKVASATEKDVEGSTPNSTPPPSELEPVVTVKTWIVTLVRSPPRPQTCNTANCKFSQFLSLGYGLCFWPVPTVSSIGSLVSADLGDPNAYVWFVPAWTIATTVSFMINGANTDILGRRWFLVGGNLICTVGHLIAGASKHSGNANLITAGMVLTGFGAGCCQVRCTCMGPTWRRQTDRLCRWRHSPFRNSCRTNGAIWASSGLMPMCTSPFSLLQSLRGLATSSRTGSGIFTVC